MVADFFYGFQGERGACSSWGCTWEQEYLRAESPCENSAKNRQDVFALRRTALLHVVAGGSARVPKTL